MGEVAKLCAMMTTHFLKKCSVEQHQTLLRGTHYLRFMMRQDILYLPPDAYGYLREIEECPEYIKKRVGACPEGYLPCEMCMLHQGFFFFLRKEVWEERAVSKEEDFIRGK